MKAVAEADAIDPLTLAARIPAGTPVLLTCSDSDGQANCVDMKPLAAALAPTALQFVEQAAADVARGAGEEDAHEGILPATKR